jgi:hypothetical protein
LENPARLTTVLGVNSSHITVAMAMVLNFP